MDTSDHQRAPNKPAPDQPEPESDTAPAPAALLPEPPPDESDVLLPAEADVIEQAHFEMLERETTQPVRRYSYAPPLTNPVREPAAEPEPVEEWSTPAQDVEPPQGSRPFEPAPFSVPPPSDRPEPVIPQRAFDPAPAPPEREPPAAGPIAAAPEAPLSAFDAPTSEPRYELDVEATQPASDVLAYEPQAATEEFAPSDEPAVEPAPVEPAPPAFSPPSEPEPAPAYQPFVAPRPSLTLDSSRWELRPEPSFEPYAAPQPSLAAVADIASPADAAPPSDWRDLARRAFSVALIVFAGWLVAVMLLIVAYRFVNPPFSMLMAQRLLGGTLIDKQWVPIDRISPNLSRAVIVAEDGRFCQHWGVDFIEAANAIRRSSTAYPRGASTITMQVAKNLFLVPTKSYLRKLVEIPLTFAIELVWPKRRILEVYLNIVEWGPGIFGAEAASRAHFGRPASALSSRQGAQLAAVLPNPIVRDAGSPGRRTANKASVIQARAAQAREASACVDPRR